MREWYKCWVFGALRWCGEGGLLIGVAVGVALPVRADDAKSADVQGPAVSIELRPDATQLEKIAAEDLKSYIARLFGADASIDIKSPAGGTVLRLAVGDNTNVEGEHQHIRLVPQPDGLLIEGGSPRAVLWGVYELVEHWGVRYLTSGDILPAEPGPFHLPEKEIVLAPNMQIRCWRLVNDLADGPVSWSLEENKRFLRQIAKMKYNRVVLSFWPCQPFVHYKFRGIEKPPGVFNFGQRFPIDDDTIGREKMGGMTEFLNPDLAGAESPEDLVHRATGLAQGIIAEAKRLGMETGIAIQPFDWPREFAPVLPGSEQARQLGGLTVGPGKEQAADDPALCDMVATVVRAYLETYPEIDCVYVGMPEWRGWTDRGQQAYDALTSQYGTEGLGSFEELCERARGRTSFPGGGGRVEQMLKGDLASLAFFDSLLRERKLLKRPGTGDVRIVYNGVVAELFPLLARMVPEGGEVVSFIDYTASRQLKQRNLLRQRPPEGLPASLIFTLADDNVGVLPQLATGSLHELMGELRASGWSGFYTRYWTVGDLDPTVHYLAKASWNPAETPEAAYRDLFTHAAGPESVEPALEAIALLEEITKGLDEHGLGFGFPVPGMMTKHYGAGGLSPAIRADHAKYRQALALLREAKKNSTVADPSLLDYLIGRLEFATHYLDAADAFGAAGEAERAGRTAESLEHLDAAVVSIRKALQAWTDVAADHGDLGAVALLNEYCYRPIRDKRNELKKRLAETYSVDPPDYSRYPAGLAGYTGVNPHEILYGTKARAVRSRIGGKGMYKPGLVRLPGGDLLASPCYEAEKGKWRVALFRSTDEGAHWTRVKTEGDDLMGKEPALAAFEDGTILLLTSHPHGFRIARSEDKGVHWSTFFLRGTPEKPDWNPGFDTVRTVLEDSKGRLSFIVSRGEWYDPSAAPSKAWIYASDDRGKTWTKEADVAVWKNPLAMFYEGSMVDFDDGRLLATGRVGGNAPRTDAPPPRGTPSPNGDESGDRMILTESTDGGLTWTEPRDFLNYSEVHAHLLRLADGRLLCTYASYHLPYGVQAVISTDEGRTWDTEHPIQLAYSMNCYTGWPTSIQLANEDIVTAYAITGYLEGEGASLTRPGKGDTVAECVRWKVLEHPTQIRHRGGQQQ